MAAVSVSANQTCPRAKFIGEPSAIVQVVPDSGVGLFQFAANAKPSRSMKPVPLPTVAENGVFPQICRRKSKA